MGLEEHWSSLLPADTGGVDYSCSVPAELDVSHPFAFGCAPSL